MTSSQGYDQAPPGRDRVGALAGLASVAAFVAGQYVAPALVWPEEQVGGVQLSFYADDRGRLLAQAVLLGVAAALFSLKEPACWSPATGSRWRRPGTARCGGCWRRSGPRWSRCRSTPRGWWSRPSRRGSG